MNAIEQEEASRVSDDARTFYGRVGAIRKGYMEQGGIIKNEEGEILFLKDVLKDVTQRKRNPLKK